MEYKMPIVSTEIILPFNTLDDEDITVADYKEKYGVDITDIFEARYDEIMNSYYIRIKKPCKIYLYHYEGYTFHNLAIVQPLLQISRVNDEGYAVFNEFINQTTFMLFVKNGVITHCGSYDNN